MAAPDMSPGQPSQRPRALRVWLVRGLVSLAVIGMLTGAFAAWGLRFGIAYVPSAWVRDRIVASVSRALEGRASVHIQHARLRHADNGQRLLVDGFAIKAPDGQTVIAAPRAEIDFDMTRLMLGSDPVRTIELQDLSVRLTMNREGRLSLLNEQAGSAGVATELAQSDLRTALGSLAGLLAGQAERVAGIDNMSLRNGRLVIDDPTHATQLVYSNFSMQFLERGKKQRDVRIAAERNGRPWSVSAKLLPDNGPERTISIALDQLPLEDVAYLMRAALDETSHVPVSGEILLRANDQAQLQHMSIAAKADGHALKAGADPAMALEHVEIKAAWTAADQTWRIDTIHASGGVNRLTVAGTVVSDGDGHRIAITSGEMKRYNPRDPERPIAIDSIQGEGGFSASGEARIDQLRLTGPQISIDIDALWPAARDVAARVNVRAGTFAAATGLAFWPKQLAPPAHEYVSQRLEKAEFDQLTMTVTIDPAARAAIVQGTDGGGVDVDLQTTARAARLQAVNGFPALDMETLAVKVKGASVIAATPRATMLTDEKTTASVADVQFECNCIPEKPSATVQFKAVGSADGAFDLMAAPLLRPVSEGLDALDATAGTIDLKFSLNIPDLQKPKISDIQVQFSGTLNNVSIEGAVPDQTLTGMNANVLMDAAGFSLKGQARIADAPAQIDLRRAAGRASGEAAITVSLDDAARAKQNIGSPGALTGPIPVRFIRGFGGTGAKPIKVEADLSRAAINGFFPGWQKPASRPGKISFTMPANTKRDDLELQDFVAESAGFALRGSAVLTPDRKLRSARLTQARLSPGDDMRIDIERTGSMMKISARGSNLDARNFLKALYAPAAKPGSGEQQDVDLDLKTSILTGHNNEAMTGVDLRMSKRNGELRQFSLSGKIGGADIRGNVSGGKLVIASGNAGGTLRFIDLYRRMIGGAMTMEATLDPQRQEGALTVQRFALRDEPALRRVTADGPPAAVGDAAREQQRAVAAGRSDVAFDRMRVDFVRSQGRLDVKEGLMLGPIVGVTIEGIVDAPRDRINMTGTYVPAFGLNNAFAQIPVVGLFLGGPQTGSLFGVNFKIGGAFSAPRVEINPLSAVAPGFLRKFFEFRRESIEGSRIYRLPDTAAGNQ